MNQKNKILVLGLGNEVLGDEGLGLKIVDDLKHSYTFPELEYAKATNGGLEILEYIRDFKALIIIDTITSESGYPGEIYYFTTENFKETLHLSSEHDINFLTTIKTGEILGFKIPRNIDILAVEINYNMQLGETFSHIIYNRYDEILDEILNFIRKKVEPDTAHIFTSTRKKKK
jgi:hydrogenase maturation protease